MQNIRELIIIKNFYLKKSKNNLADKKVVSIFAPAFEEGQSFLGCKFG